MAQIKLFFLLFVFSGISVVAQTNDGPYVFHKDNGIQIINILPKDTLLQNLNIQIKNIKVSKKDEAPSFWVVPTSGSQDAFKVQMQTEHIKQKSVYKEPKKLLALSDIEGNFYAMKKILVGAKVMSENYQWIFGDGHLVFVGDMFDRGLDVTQCLWLIYELERQAELHGGKVHFVMGNHENMNLRGNTRYVRDKYTKLSKQLDLPNSSLYGTNTELGKWLRTKNTVVKIGTTLYVHAGISTDIVDKKYTLDQINTIAKKYYGNPNRNKIPEAALIFNTKKGPLWYRGYFRESLDTCILKKITNHFGVENIVVGHTLQDKINTAFENRVIAIDLKHPNSKNDGKKVKVLFKKDSKFYVVDENNHSKLLF